MKEKEILQSFYIVHALRKTNLFTFHAGYTGDFNAFSRYKIVFADGTLWFFNITEGRFREEKKGLKSWGLEKYENNELRRISGQKVLPKRQWIKLQRFFYRKLGAQNVSNTTAGSMRTKETAIRLHTMPELLMGQNVWARSSHLQPTHWHSITFFVLTCSVSYKANSTCMAAKNEYIFSW